MSEEQKVDYEKQLEEIGEKLGKMMGSASPEEKAKMHEMIREVDEFVKEESKTGKVYDKSALFAAALIVPSFCISL